MMQFHRDSENGLYDKLKHTIQTNKTVFMLLPTYHNLFMTLMPRPKLESKSVKQLCCTQTKVQWVNRKLTIMLLFLFIASVCIHHWWYFFLNNLTIHVTVWLRHFLGLFFFYHSLPNYATCIINTVTNGLFSLSFNTSHTWQK